jgi:hypothetical protein
MRIAHLAVLSLLTVAACESKPRADETGRAQEGADTLVTTDQTVDTTVVTKDTAVDVDTATKEGDTTIKDTLQK